MDKKIKETLEHIGLTRGEIDVYIALLKLGLSTTGKITKLANISSSKVYEVLQRLINKGLANYVIENGKHYYSATPARRLVDFLEDKKNALSESQEIIKELIPEIESKREENKTPEAIIYRGKKGPLIALNEVLDQYKKGAKESIGYGTDEDDYVKHFPAQLNDFLKKAKKYKVNERLLFVKGFKSPNPYAKIRYLSEEYLSPVRIMVCNNKVFIVDFTEPMTTIVIEKEEIARAYMNHFNILWKKAKK